MLFRSIAKNFLNETYLSEEELLGKGKNKIKISSLSPDEFLKFVCQSSDISFRAKNVMEVELKENGQEDLYFNIEFPLIFVLADMELTGIKIDGDKLSEYSSELSQKIDFLVNPRF